MYGDVPGRPPCAHPPAGVCTTGAVCTAASGPLAGHSRPWAAGLLAAVSAAFAGHGEREAPESPERKSTVRTSLEGVLLLNSLVLLLL